MGGTIRDTNRGYAELVRAVFDMGKPKVHVGIIEGAAGVEPSGGATILDIATWAEFGTATEPARSFIRAWFDEDEANLREVLAGLMRRVLSRELTKEQALEQLGQLAVGRVQGRIAAGIDPPNAPSTIAKKGSSTPLIYMGVLRSSVTYKVEP
jgi:hypothetical protein